MSAVRYRSQSATDQPENSLSSLSEQKNRSACHDEIEPSSPSSRSRAFATRKACLLVAEPFFSGSRRALPGIPRGEPAARIRDAAACTPKSEWNELCDRPRASVTSMHSVLPISFETLTLSIAPGARRVTESALKCSRKSHRTRYPLSGQKLGRSSFFREYPQAHLLFPCFSKRGESALGGLESSPNALALAFNCRNRLVFSFNRSRMKFNDSNR